MQEAPTFPGMTGIQPTHSFPRRWIDHGCRGPSFMCGSLHFPPSPSFAYVEAVAGEPGARSALQSPFPCLGPIIQSLVKLHFPPVSSRLSKAVVARSVAQRS